ncbi:MAG: cytochrome c oxidase subunit II [Pikeienuella sp.]|uniref:cytochrome c oxidase subunit II n=1 Tax=Pikeienuella sp. TaxID=2831957 RepID=UPI00391A7A43
MTGAKLAARLSAAAATALIAGAAAAESVGKPVPDGIGFQPAVTELMRDLVWFDAILHWISLAIVVLVTALLGIVIFRFSEKKNPTPARFTHHVGLEVAWTAGPIVILFVIGAISLPILFKQLDVPEPDLTIKATGNQWYWSYEYPDEEIGFDAIMLARDELGEYGYADDEYLLATDTAMVVPVGANVHLLVTGADVIHAWTIPSFGVKVDAIPGRMNELWFNADRVGTYFGQCSELCGKDHSYMPITVKVVSAEDYAAWVDETRVAQGLPPKNGVTLAAAD